MPHTWDELAEMIAKRDNISFNEAMIAVKETARDLEHAFYNGSITEAEDILNCNLGLEPDYLDVFIY